MSSPVPGGRTGPGTKSGDVVGPGTISGGREGPGTTSADPAVAAGASGSGATSGLGDPFFRSFSFGSASFGADRDFFPGFARGP